MDSYAWDNCARVVPGIEKGSALQEFSRQIRRASNAALALALALRSGMESEMFRHRNTFHFAGKATPCSGKTII